MSCVAADATCNGRKSLDYMRSSQNAKNQAGDHMSLRHVNTSFRASFMTDEMWLAWLTNSNIRGKFGLVNVEAQRDFAAWWVLNGENHYPKAWALDEEILSVALEERICIHNVLSLPRILALIYESRTDLQKTFPIPPKQNISRLIEWYNKFAANEYACAPQLPDWFLDRNYVSGGRKIAQVQRSNHQHSVSADDFSLSGVNLIGYPRGEFGIGEDLRMVSRALDDANIPYAVFDLKTGSNARQNERFCEGYISDILPFYISIMCTSAFDAARIYLEYGKELFSNHYTIGYWPWELERFPVEWSDVFKIVQEIWGASAFTTESYSEISGTKVRRVSPAVHVIPTETKPSEREYYQFICPFDPNSAMERKNPIAAATAFRKAFPSEIKDVRLLFAINGSLPPHRQTEALLAASAADERIHLCEGTLERGEYHRLIETSDCLVSPHRAEGFGRNIAEAKALGIAVLATGYSGCNDFLHAQEMISWSPITLGPEDYPYGVGSVWADIDVDDLARKMCELYQRRVSTPAAPLSTIYSISATAERLKGILDVITCDIKKTVS